MLVSWTPLGPLIKVLGDVGSRPLRIPIGAKVKDAYDLSGWRLPLSRSFTADSILSHLTPLPAPLPHLESDSYYWSVTPITGVWMILSFRVTLRPRLGRL